MSRSFEREVARRALERHLSGAGVAWRVYEMGARDEPVADRVREALRAGCDLVVACGGDGTVSSVANPLIGTDTPLGIVPLGTTNVLARELGVPVDPDAALALLTGGHALALVDAMAMGPEGRACFTQLGVGLDALMIRDTGPEQKKRFGRLAYLWTAATRLAGFQPRRFLLTVDGATARPRASQVVVANAGTLGQPPLRWGPDIRPDDGVLDVCVIRARTVWDGARVAWNFVLGRHRRAPNVWYLTARREVTVATAKPKPLPVQADGEIVGQTPVTVRVRPGAVKVVVPAVPGA
jgi:YegS/Rv2252/BmrU family lipid kinase